MALPNFVVIGASRSGTTSLHHYLGQHPDIYVPPRKSPNYFVSQDPQPRRENTTLQSMATQWVSSREAYEALFKGLGDERAIGDISPVYLQSLYSAQRIKQTLAPGVKIIALLRNPADRAYAHYQGRRRDGLEQAQDFRAVVERELAGPQEEEIAFGNYTGCGRYHHFLKPYYDHFAPQDIRVYLFEQLQHDAAGLLRDLFTFLEVDPGFSVDMGFAHNKTGEISNPLLRALWTNSVGLRTALRPYMPAFVRHSTRGLLAQQVSRSTLEGDLRQQIISTLREDILQLQQLIDKDLSGWLEPRSHPHP